jgi:hypothetical protein
MKRVQRTIMLLLPLFLVGCMGWGDFMKFPPGDQRLWGKHGVTEKDLYVDLQACSDEARAVGISPGTPRQHFEEACMLEKGYIFTNYRSRDFADYCSKDWFGGGPACKSVGR